MTMKMANQSSTYFAQADSTAGSPSIPEQWLNLHGDALFRYALVLVADEHHAEDLVQETLLAALKSRERYSAAASERTWLIAILRHKALDDRRRNHRRDQYLAGVDPAVEGNFNRLGKWRKPPGRWTPAPQALLESQEFRTVFQSCMSALPRACARHSLCAWSKALTQPRPAGYWKSRVPISGHCSTGPASGSAAVWKASGLAKRNADMFSCRQAVRRTLDMLEGRLSPTERLARSAHLCSVVIAVRTRVKSTASSSFSSPRTISPTSPCPASRPRPALASRRPSRTRITPSN